MHRARRRLLSTHALGAASMASFAAPAPASAPPAPAALDLPTAYMQASSLEPAGFGLYSPYLGVRPDMATSFTYQPRGNRPSMLEPTPAAPTILPAAPYASDVLPLESHLGVTPGTTRSFVVAESDIAAIANAAAHAAAVACGASTEGVRAVYGAALQAAAAAASNASSVRSGRAAEMEAARKQQQLASMASAAVARDAQDKAAAAVAASVAAAAVTPATNLLASHWYYSTAYEAALLNAYNVSLGTFRSSMMWPPMMQPALINAVAAASAAAKAQAAAAAEAETARTAADETDAQDEDATAAAAGKKRPHVEDAQPQELYFPAAVASTYVNHAEAAQEVRKRARLEGAARAATATSKSASAPKVGTRVVSSTRVAGAGKATGVVVGSSNRASTAGNISSTVMPAPTTVIPANVTLDDACRYMLPAAPSAAPSGFCSYLDLYRKLQAFTESGGRHPVFLRLPCTLWTAPAGFVGEFFVISKDFPAFFVNCPTHAASGVKTVKWKKSGSAQVRDMSVVMPGASLMSQFAVARSVVGNRKMFSARVSCIVRDSTIQGIHIVQVRVSEEKPVYKRPVPTGGVDLGAPAAAVLEDELGPEDEE